MLTKNVHRYISRDSSLFCVTSAAHSLRIFLLFHPESSESPTLARFVEALSSADPFALQNALERNSLELIDGRKGSVDKDHWSFCIGLGPSSFQLKFPIC